MSYVPTVFDLPSGAILSHEEVANRAINQFIDSVMVDAKGVAFREALVAAFKIGVTAGEVRMRDKAARYCVDYQEDMPIGPTAHIVLNSVAGDIRAFSLSITKTEG